MSNRKVKNATTIEYDNIVFDSKLEMSCYKYFKDNGILLQREPVTFDLVKSFNHNIKLYLPGKKTKNSKNKPTLLKLNTTKIRGMTYTPDFILEHKNDCFIIEVKGKPNDVYPYKRKLFISLLNKLHEDTGKQFWFFEPHNLAQIKQIFEIINEQYGKH